MVTEHNHPILQLTGESWWTEVPHGLNLAVVNKAISGLCVVREDLKLPLTAVRSRSSSEINVGDNSMLHLFYDLFFFWDQRLLTPPVK